MTYNVVRLELDITGTNPDNRIIDEPHTLSDNSVRSIAPNYGPFFAESVIVKDGVNILIRGVNYQIAELHQEATLRYGKEISSVILIIDKNVSSNVTITYQALGGHYCYTDYAIANLYESISKDNRPVDWSNVLEKPTEYPPTIHRHLVEDIYGFEPIVDYLERIRQAITLGQTNVVLRIIDGLLARYNCDELPKVKPTPKILTYDAFLHFITQKKLINQVSIKFKDCYQYLGGTLVLEIDSRGYPSGTTLYWQFYTVNSTQNTIYDSQPHAFKTTNSLQYIYIYLPTSTIIQNTNIYVGVKANSNDNEFIAVSYLPNLLPNLTTDTVKYYLLFHNKNFKSSYSLFYYDQDNDERHCWVLTQTRNRKYEIPFF